jgi:hypothetical protein
MATTATRKRITAADVAAAVALGAMPADAEVITGADAAAEDQSTETRTDSPAALAADHHECGIPGCRHGANHGSAPQPDRQLKLQAPCGAVARMTARALAMSGGAILCGHGDTFAVAARRTYTRKVAM